MMFLLHQAEEDVAATTTSKDGDAHMILGLVTRGLWMSSTKGFIKVVYAGGDEGAETEVELICDHGARSDKPLLTSLPIYKHRRLYAQLFHACFCPDVDCAGQREIARSNDDDGTLTVSAMLTKDASTAQHATGDTEHNKLGGSLGVCSDCIGGEGADDSRAPGTQVASPRSYYSGTTELEVVGDETAVLASDFFKASAVVLSGWENQLQFTPRDTRTYQSAVRAKLSEFYNELEQYEFTRCAC